MKKYYWRVCYSICKHLHKHSINYTLILIYFTFFFLSDRIVICAIIKRLFLTFYTPIIISCQLQTRLSACLFSSVKCLDRVPLVHLYLFLSNNWFFFFFFSSWFLHKIQYRCAVTSCLMKIWQYIQGNKGTLLPFPNTVIGKAFESFMF